MVPEMGVTLGVLSAFSRWELRETSILDAVKVE